MSKYQVRYPIGLDLQVGAAHGAHLGTIRVPSEGGSGHDQPAENPWERFHLKGFRRHDGSTPDLPQAAEPRVVGAIMPLISVLIPEWLRVLRKKALQEGSQVPTKKVVVLLSGSAQPRDSKADPRDNSTEGTAQIMKRFLNLCYPDIEVVTIGSRGGIFRYDDNVNFVKEQARGRHTPDHRSAPPRPLRAPSTC